MPASDLVQYYAQRAPEYEKIYAIPERQADLEALRNQVREIFAGKRVLEVACGTGYWTEVLVDSAESVFATDINDQVLEIALAKPRIAASKNVQMAKSDVFNLDNVPTSNASLCAFWWSHLKKKEIGNFLSGLHKKLEPRSRVVFIDNRFVAGSSTPIHRIDSDGNSFQLRNLRDGTQHEVLKNFPSESELLEAVAPWTSAATVTELNFYWLLEYELRA